MRTSWILRICGFCILLLAPSYGLSQNNEAKPLENAPGDEEITDRFLQNPAYEQAPEKILNPDEVRSLCRKYKNKYISFAGSVYRINENCQKQLLSPDETFKLQRQSSRAILDLEGSTDFSAFSSSPEKLIPKKDLSELCLRLEGRYITFASVDLYYVDDCKKRKFPDYESYEHHRKKMNLRTDLILSLEQNEFDAIPQGEDFLSIIDEGFKERLKMADSIEILPIDIACRGLIGKYVSYLGDIYLIKQIPPGVLGSHGEHCERIKIDSSAFTRQNNSYTPTELSSSVAQSIPIKKPIE